MFRERRCGNFEYNLSQASFEKEWGKNYDKPSVWDKFLAFVIRVTPKIGPLKVLAFRTPTPEMERMFMDSFNVALAEYRRLLAEVKEDRLNLPNRNFDTGSPIQPGTSLAVRVSAYAHLLHLLAKDPVPSGFARFAFRHSCLLCRLASPGGGTRKVKRAWTGRRCPQKYSSCRWRSQSPPGSRRRTCLVTK